MCLGRPGPGATQAPELWGLWGREQGLPGALQWPGGQRDLEPGQNQSCLESWGHRALGRPQRCSSQPFTRSGEARPGEGRGLPRTGRWKELLRPPYAETAAGGGPYREGLSEAGKPSLLPVCLPASSSPHPDPQTAALRHTWPGSSPGWAHPGPEQL